MVVVLAREGGEVGEGGLRMGIEETFKCVAR